MWRQVSPVIREQFLQLNEVRFIMLNEFVRPDHKLENSTFLTHPLCILLVVNHSSRADEEQKSRVFAEKEEEQIFFLLFVSMGMKKALWHCLTLTDWDVNN